MITVRPYRNLATDTLDFYVTKVEDNRYYVGKVEWKAAGKGNLIDPALCLDRHATQEFATEMVRQGVVDTNMADGERKAMRAHIEDLQRVKQEYTQIISILLDKGK